MAKPLISFNLTIRLLIVVILTIKTQSRLQRSKYELYLRWLKIRTIHINYLISAKKHQGTI